MRCFNHTLQLAAKSLLKPFTSQSKGKQDNNNTVDDSADPTFTPFDDNEDMPGLQDGFEMELPDENDDGEEDLDGKDDEDEHLWGNILEELDEIEEMEEDDRETLLSETKTVRTTLLKVCSFTLCLCCPDQHLQIRKLSFAIVHSTTIALPEWRRICDHHDLRIRLIP